MVSTAKSRVSTRLEGRRISEPIAESEVERFCEPYREATKPTDPGCSTTGEGTHSGNGTAWTLFGLLGWVMLRVARKRTTKAPRSKR